MVSGDILYVFLLIMETRVHVILKFSSVSCYLSNTMSCTDREHWSDYNQVSVSYRSYHCNHFNNTPFLVTV